MTLFSNACIVLFVISCCIRSLLLFRRTHDEVIACCTLCKRQLLRPKGISNCQFLSESSYCKYSLRHSLRRRRYIFTCMKFLLPYVFVCFQKVILAAITTSSLLPYSQFLMSKMSKLLQTMGPHVNCFSFCLAFKLGAFQVLTMARLIDKDNQFCFHQAHPVFI